MANTRSDSLMCQMCPEHSATCGLPEIKLSCQALPSGQDLTVKCCLAALPYHTNAGAAADGQLVYDLKRLVQYTLSSRQWQDPYE